MKKLSLITFSLLITGVVYGQNVEEYFHGGAQSFINSDLQSAISQVQNGLYRFPNDPKLNALMEKLQEEKKKQEQQQQQQQNQDQQQQEQNQQQQQDQDQENQDEQQQQESEGEEQDQEDPQEMNPEDMQPQQMSKEDAEKILQALAQKEKELLKEFKKKKTDGSAKHEKDW